MQRLITWSFKLTQDSDWATRIDNWIGLIKTKIDTVPALRPWQKPKLAWFFHYCLTGQYEPWTASQPQQGQLMEI
ncbi:MAG: hypothetical protein E6Q97_25590 [Desulfurellales bacterium]|nr:MAG: hypothetical protein E6Q97_25590 [Desulfurellales bacterium]